MKVVLQCECGCKDFELSEYADYAKCKMCNTTLYMRDSEYEFDYEDTEEEKEYLLNIRIKNEIQDLIREYKMFDNFDNTRPKILEYISGKIEQSKTILAIIQELNNEVE